MKVQERTKSLKEVRLSGCVPGVIYGKGMQSTSVQVERKEFTKAYAEYGKNMTFTIKLGKEDHIVYIKDIQREVVKNEVINFDLQKVMSTDTISAELRLVFDGRDVVSRNELVLITNLNELEVEYLVGTVISNLHVDVSNMVEDEMLHVKDLVIPAGITVLNKPEEVVVSLVKSHLVVEAPEEDEEESAEASEEDESEE